MNTSPDCQVTHKVWTSSLIICSLTGLIFFSFILLKISAISSIGFSEDASGYAEIASNIASGRGPVQDFIDFYFTRYPQTITHPTRHWLSLYAFYLVPGISLFGTLPFLVKLVSTLFYLLAGFAIFYLIARWSDPVTGCITALLYYLHPTAIYCATQGLPDLLFLFFFMTSLYFVAGKKRSDSIWLALSCSLLILVKATALLLIMLLIGGAVVIPSLISRTRIAAALLMTIILLAGASLVSPEIRQTLSPSDHTMLLGRLGYTDNILDAHYGIAWDTTTTAHLNPSSLYDRALLMATTFFSTNYYAESGMGIFRLFLFPLTLFTIPGLIILKTNALRFLAAGTICLWLFFFSVVFTPADRYFLPVIAMMLFLVTQGARWLAERIPLHSELFRNRVMFGFFALIILTTFWRDTIPTLSNFSHSVAYNPYNEMIFSEQTALDPVFRYIDVNLPQNAVIMTLLPATVNFCTNRKTVPLPYEDYLGFAQVVSWYKVTFLLDLYPKRIYDHRLSLPGLIPMKQWKTSDGVVIALYSIDHTRLCPQESRQKPGLGSCFPTWAMERGFLYCPP